MNTLRTALPALVLVFFVPPLCAHAQEAVELYKLRLEQSKPIVSTSKGLSFPGSPSAAKKGDAAYDLYPEPWRSVFIEDWRKEAQAVRKAMDEDKDRLRRAKNAAEVQKLNTYIRYYSERLTTLEKNDPPFVHPDAMLAMITMAKPVPAKPGGVGEKDVKKAENAIAYDVLKKVNRKLDGKFVMTILVSEAASKDEVLKLAGVLQREHAGKYACISIFDSRKAWQAVERFDESYPDKELYRHWLVDIGDLLGGNEIRWVAKGRNR